MKVLKYLGIGLLAVVVLIVVAAAAVVVFVDPNEFKPQIAQAVKAETGREIIFEGDLELTLFPWLGVKVGPTRLANAEGFGDEPFAEVEELDIKVRIAPLIERRIEADTVTVKGLKLRLRREADGRTNWDDLAGSARGGATGKKSGRTTDREKPAAKPSSRRINA